MTRDQEKQAKTAKPGIEGADRTALVDLMFQRAGEKMKAAMAEKDDTRIVHLAMDACHEARFALEEMHQQHVDPATVVDAAEAFDFALVDVLARVHRLDQQRHARDAGIHHAS